MTKDEARKILIAYVEWRHGGESAQPIWDTKIKSTEFFFEAIDCAIQALGDGEEHEPIQDEFTELVDIARRMQSLYQNGRFGLSDEAMTTATAHLDDLRRIPSPPKPNQP